MVILGVSSLKKNLTFRIQMLVINNLNPFPDLRSEEASTLVLQRNAFFEIS